MKCSRLAARGGEDVGRGLGPPANVRPEATTFSNRVQTGKNTMNTIKGRKLLPVLAGAPFYFANDTANAFKWVKLDRLQASNTVNSKIASIPAAAPVRKP
jgi:hypothetical protein